MKRTLGGENPISRRFSPRFEFPGHRILTVFSVNRDHSLGQCSIMRSALGHGVNAEVCQSNMTVLPGEAALFIPAYECNSPAAPSDVDRLISRYRVRAI